MIDEKKGSLEPMRTPCEVYSRVCGYLRPTSQWNDAKVSEFKDRTTFKV
jgi:ribonucleoside-triphosphate reductase